MKKALSALLLSFLLLSCTPAEASSGPSSPVSSEPSSEPSSSLIPSPYQEKSVDVHYVGKKGSAKIRYYGESEIPYMGVRAYFSMVAQDKASFSIQKDGDSYKLKNFLDVEGTFDLKKQTFDSPDFEAFHVTDLKATKEIPRVFWDGLPFVKPKAVEVDKDPNPFHIDFKNYGISFYADEDDVYLPFFTVADFFRGVDLLGTAFDGTAIYVYYETLNEEFSAFQNVFRFHEKDPSPEYAQYNYNEICLRYDLFSGRPGRSSLERYYDLSGGLDAALEKKPLGKAIKGYLQSTDFANYVSGVYLLNLLVQDGGHSGYYYVPTFNKAPAIYNQIKTQVNQILNSYSATDYPEIQNADRGYHHRDEVDTARIAFTGDESSFLDTPRGEQTYFAKGDTAYLFLDDYMGEIYNQQKWFDYYDGKRDSIPYGPSEGGIVVSLVKGLEKARNDSSIKNVVIDLTRNGGGSTDELTFVLGALTGNSNLHLYDQRSGQHLELSYEIDYNFDRVFDERDDQIDFLGDLNVAVMMSQNSFSCGGISPIYLHDAGIYTLGDDSGGGSCSVLGSFDIYGLYFRGSAPEPILDKNGISIDEARFNSCDTKLPLPTSQDGWELDFSSFYDVTNISSLIHSHYGK